MATPPMNDHRVLVVDDDDDKKFLERFDNWIYANLSRSDMQAMDFANSMKMGRTFKEYFGLTASQFRKGGKPNPNGTPPATES